MLDLFYEINDKLFLALCRTLQLSSFNKDLDGETKGRN